MTLRNSRSSLLVALVGAVALMLPVFAVAANPEIRAVPSSVADPAAPHVTYPGRVISLKAVANVGAQSLATWDFGDGSAPVTFALGNSSIVSANHLYLGQPGTVFTAKLTIVDAATGVAHSALYPVVVREKSLATEVNVAIDQGLWQLYQTLHTSRPDARTAALAVLAFERNGHLESGDPSDPYTDIVADGLRVLLASRSTGPWASRAIQAAGAPNARTSTGLTYRQLLESLRAPTPGTAQPAAHASPEELLLALAEQEVGQADTRWTNLETQIRDSNNLDIDTELLLALTEALQTPIPPIRYLRSASGLGDLDWYAADRTLGDSTDGVARVVLNRLPDAVQPAQTSAANIAQLILSITPKPQTPATSSVNNVTSQIRVTQTGFVRNHFTGAFSTTLTVTNTSAQTIPGPLTLGLPNLTPTVTLTNRNGIFNGDPYIALQSGALAPSGSVNVALTFSNPTNGYITFDSTIYSGTFPPAALQLACPTATVIVGTPYSSSLTATGSVQPYTYSLSSGSLPHNLTLNTATGAITGTPDVVANSNFTGRVDDSSGGTPQNATANCSINVTTPNQAPVAVGQSPTTNEDTALPLTLTGTDADGNSLTFSIVNPPVRGTLGSFSGLSCSGNPSTCHVNVTYTPSQDYNGSDSFTFKVNDGTVDSAPATVSITVNAVNDPPSFTKGPNIIISDAAPAQTVLNWATNISAGPPDESGQLLNFIVSNDNNALFSAQPAISSSGTLTFTPAPLLHGTAIVSVQLHDNGGGADTSAVQTFTITTTLTQSGSFIDTTQADFQAGTPTNLNLTVSPGDVVLAGGVTVDQQNSSLGTSGVGITTTTWGGQTFTPSVSGPLVKADINLFCSGCTGTTPNLTLSLRATSNGLPTGTDLASATVTGFNSGSAVFYTATFSTPPNLTAGTQYALVIRPTVNPSPGTYALTRSGTATAGSDVYAGGTRVAGAVSGTVWSIPLTSGVSTDAGFRIYINESYSNSGDLISSVKDSAPGTGTTTWNSISWTAATPADTSVQFQVAASNLSTGPFNFVGPDGTAATFFTTSGVSLSLFNGFRYLQYRAFLNTTDTTVTPALSDVTISYTTIQ
jgi:hypothetical protein